MKKILIPIALCFAASAAIALLSGCKSTHVKAFVPLGTNIIPIEVTSRKFWLKASTGVDVTITNFGTLHITDDIDPSAAMMQAVGDIAGKVTSAAVSAGAKAVVP